MARRFRVLALLAAACCALFALPAPAGAQPSPRRVSVVVSPAEGDFALTRLSFPAAHGRALTRSSLRLLAPSFAADDAIALATPGEPSRGRSRRSAARRRPAHEPRRADLGEGAPRWPAPASGRSGSRASRTRSVATGRRRAGCAGSPPTAAPRRSARSAPTAARLAGLNTAGAVAQAFEIACGLPAGPQLKAALAPRTRPAEPAPPAPERPECAPCNPRPGYACPLAARPAYCVARREQTGAH